ncbi:hypothetical protein [Halomonas sp. Y3]|uniref:hypothetical protein n=1 Tax=Halomonas sp. Y3 TaxID=2956797 RepID=UPI00209E3F98|nr:hypothetical protein [Halomonas sp. Y3]
MNFLFLALAAVVNLTAVDIYMARAGILGLGSFLGVFLSFAAFFLAFYLFPHERIGFYGGGRVVKKGGGVSPSFFPIVFGLLFIFFMIIPTIFSEEIGVGFLTLFRYLLFFFASVIILLSFRRVGRCNAFFSVVLFSLAILIISLFFEAFVPGTFARRTTRAGGILVNPNLAAHSISIMFFLALLLSNSRRSVMFLLMFYPFALLAVAFTISRSGFVLFGIFSVALLVRVVYYFNLKSVLMYSLFVFSFLMLAVPFFIYSIPIFGSLTSLERMSSSLSLDFYLDFDDGRVGLLHDYLSKLDSKALLGNGAGWTASGSNLIDGATHNMYIKVLFEGGVLSLVFYLAFLLSPMLLFNESIFVRLSLVVFLIALGFFTNYLLDHRVFYFLVLAPFFLSPSLANSIEIRKGFGR